MNILRRFLGVLVMIAGVLGLILSLTGLIGVWLVKPTMSAYIDSTITTLNSSINTSQQAMEITQQALVATVDSVDALSVMLSATAASVEDTLPLIDQLNTFLADNLPTTMESASTSLRAAQQGAQVLDSAIQSLENFRSVLSGTPLLRAFLDQPETEYDPETSLGDSLGTLASDLDALPEMFSDMATNLDTADENLITIKSSLVTMAESVDLISESLSEYEAMVTETQSSMENLKSILGDIQNNLSNILNGVAIVLSLVFLWLLAAQVVILSQGWELFQGTATHMEGREPPSPTGQLPVDQLAIEEPNDDEPAS